MNHFLSGTLLKDHADEIVRVVNVVLLVLGGAVLTFIVQRLIRSIRTYSVRLMVRHGETLSYEVEKRAATVAGVVRKPLLIVIWLVIILAALKELGFNVETLLAGAGISAGILGVAVGFGAQNLIKDVIAGLFLLMENQIRVRDVAVINGTSGSVEEINLRTTVLRGENGAVHVFPNGSIQTLSNLTREFSYYVFDIRVAYEQDADRVMAIIREIGADLRTDSVYASSILDEVDVMGVDRFGDSGLTIKARIKTLPVKQWIVGREMNRRIRNRFIAEHIEMPATSAVVRIAQPSPLQTDRDELKSAIREVLDEMRSANRTTGATE